MKKFLSLTLALILALGTCICASAANENPLQFHEDGSFRIVHLTDIQDTYPMQETTVVYINEMLQTLKPDLVVLGGDNCVAGLEGDDNYTTYFGEKKCYDDLTDEEFALVESEYIDKVKEIKEKAYKQLCDLFVNNETYFTFVFGNHDHQSFGRNSETYCQEIKEYLFSLFKNYGGEYCLAEDEADLFGVGTHNLTVASSKDINKTAFNIYMMDSNTYYFDENGVEMGYDAVHTDQIEWYKQTAAQLKEENGGKVVPALMFQHIIVQESYEELFIEVPFDAGAVGEDFVGTDGEIHHYIYLPKVAGIKDGYLFEKCCPGYVNYGQFDALVETGDVMGIFSGHDHQNNFTVERDGINISNTGGCTYWSYGSDVNRGVRVIDLDENDLSTYESWTYTVCEAAMQEGSQISEIENTEVSSFKAAFKSIFGINFMNGLVAVLRVVFFWSKWL